jgi:putative lipoprotein (rSAM/lipoprotein system)
MKLLKLKSGFYKRVLGVFGAAGFLVTFQACYGTPQNYVNVSGNVKDKDTNQGVANLQVSVYSDTDSVCLTTDENGNFNQSIITDSNFYVKIKDVDGAQNGEYLDFDTTLTDKDHELQISLEEN